jgi:hypothetical protein
MKNLYKSIENLEMNETFKSNPMESVNNGFVKKKY